MKVLIFVFALVITNSLGLSTSWMKRQLGLEEEKVVKRPNRDFCGDHECPDYDVVTKFEKGYELRRYKPSVWVQTAVPYMDEEYWQNRWFTRSTYLKLFRYIRGGNDRDMVLDMTVPVLNTHQMDAVHMCFMVPSSLAADPPTPSDPDVTIYRNDEGGMFYVRSFGGFPYGMFGFQNHFKTEFDKLVSDLAEDNQGFNSTEMFFTAVYNSPWKLYNRHNEVWIFKS